MLLIEIEGIIDSFDTSLLVLSGCESEAEKRIGIVGSADSLELTVSLDPI